MYSEECNYLQKRNIRDEITNLIYCSLNKEENIFLTKDKCKALSECYNIASQDDICYEDISKVDKILCNAGLLNEGDIFM